jgi:hypothetical protein
MHFKRQGHPLPEEVKEKSKCVQSGKTKAKTATKKKATTAKRVTKSKKATK